MSRASRSRSKKSGSHVIAENRRARHEYFVEDTLEAGLVLQGWEIKSMRSGQARIAESYISLRRGECWLIGSHIQPLPNAAHLATDPTRMRKLLLHRKEIARLQGTVQRQGYTLVPLSLYWKQGRAKLSLAIARGKMQHDRRQAVKERDWQRSRQRALRHQPSTTRPG